MKRALFIAFVAVACVGLWNCNPSQQLVSPTDPDDSSTARLASDSSGFFCKDSVTRLAVSDLPIIVTSHITTNYAGATIDYAVKDDEGNYLVAITQNDQRKALLFNADGSFNQEVSIRGGGKGRGGPQGHGGKGGKSRRDSLEKVTVAELPSAITTYIGSNYAGAQIKLAVKDEQRGYVVMIVQNDQRKTLVFNADGSFNQETTRPVKGNVTAVAAADLPSGITVYISSNYPNSTIKQAGKTSDGQFIVWVQPATGKNVALLFAADGSFRQVLKGR